MLNPTLKTLSLVAVATFGLSPAFGFTDCPNCSAEVVIASSQAQNFADLLMSINSMPLTGEIIAVDEASGLSTVRVDSYFEYAQREGINSFDVAQRALKLASQYSVREVRALVRPFDAELEDVMSNVGTIGHR